MSSPVADCLQRHMAARAARLQTPLTQADRRRLTGAHAAARRVHRNSMAHGSLSRPDRTRLWPHANSQERIVENNPIDLRVLRSQIFAPATNRFKSIMSELMPPVLAACLILGIGEPAAASDPARATRLPSAPVKAAPLLPSNAIRKDQGFLWTAVYVRPLPAGQSAPRSAVRQPTTTKAETRGSANETRVSGSASVPYAIVAANQTRSRHGLHALRHSTQLDRAAMRHVNWMLQSGKFSHTGEGGTRVQHRIRATGYEACYGAENLAKGPSTIDAVIGAWMNSPGHRRNLLSSRGAEIGIAMVRNARGQTYWAMVLGTKCA